MSNSLCKSSVYKAYQDIISDVIANVREHFLEDGVDETVLQELKSLWETKLATTKAVEEVNEVDKIIAINTKPTKLQQQQTNYLNEIAQQQFQQKQIVGQVPPNNHIPQGIAFPEWRRVPVQLTIPSPPGSGSDDQRVLGIEVPEVFLQGHHLKSILTGPIISATMNLPIPAATAFLQDQVNNAFLKHQQSTNFININMGVNPSVIQTDGSSSQTIDEDDILDCLKAKQLNDPKRWLGLLGIYHHRDVLGQFISSENFDRCIQEKLKIDENSVIEQKHNGMTEEGLREFLRSKRSWVQTYNNLHSKGRKRVRAEVERQEVRQIETQSNNLKDSRNLYCTSRIECLPKSAFARYPKKFRENDSNDDSFTMMAPKHFNAPIISGPQTVSIDAHKYYIQRQSLGIKYINSQNSATNRLNSQPSKFGQRSVHPNNFSIKEKIPHTLSSSEHEKQLMRVEVKSSSDKETNTYQEKGQFLEHDGPHHYLLKVCKYLADIIRSSTVSAHQYVKDNNYQFVVTTRKYLTEKVEHQSSSAISFQSLVINSKSYTEAGTSGQGYLTSLSSRSAQSLFLFPIAVGFPHNAQWSTVNQRQASDGGSLSLDLPLQPGFPDNSFNVILNINSINVKKVENNVQVKTEVMTLTPPEREQADEYFRRMVQGDGPADSSDEDDAFDDEEEDDYVNEEIEDDKNDTAEDEPLNSEDDVSDADGTEESFETENVIVCQFDKITRARNRWKFHLKDGIMNLNGEDFIFQKANGEAEW